MSKGSKQRPTNKLQFDTNYTNINWSKKKESNGVKHNNKRKNIQSDRT